MTGLRVSVRGVSFDTPFLTRLRADAGQSSSPLKERDSQFVCSDGEWSSYSHNGFEFDVKAPACTLDNDVLLVFPGQNTGHRIIRAQSSHNTFLVTEQCDQICVMCSQPPKQHHADLFDLFYEAALLAPEHAVLGVSGGEPLLHKERLFHLIEKALCKRGDLSFHVLTNGQHFSSEDNAFLSSSLAQRILWGVPIYAHSAPLHDQIVGKSGAFERLIESFYTLSKTLARIELRTVLLQTNYPVFPQLADLISTYLPFAEYWAIMQLENIGYGKMNWRTEFHDSSVEFENVARALNIANGRGLEAYLYNFPLCTIPRPYRRYAVNSISDWKQKYLQQCVSCSQKHICGGFFQWYNSRAGFERTGAI